MIILKVIIDLNFHCPDNFELCECLLEFEAKRKRFSHICLNFKDYTCPDKFKLCGRSLEFTDVQTSSSPPCLHTSYIHLS